MRAKLVRMKLVFGMAQPTSISFLATWADEGKANARTAAQEIIPRQPLKEEPCVIILGR